MLFRNNYVSLTENRYTHSARHATQTYKRIERKVTNTNASEIISINSFRRRRRKSSEKTSHACFLPLHLASRRILPSPTR